ncbi:TetR/AcrR family transcriptional regulator [Rhodovulum adriaticum]|uniref:TetR family transcriptional regulator n=1 Tax=Rhodovulum adriaticum TaxID=35804 RepID=A0A4R2NI63_RHOAD|nr:TetR/AcrR family transcriptional regulator [Rhodovulum adriaticum]MBK1637262.1 TetR family transcriptional regulator [Rhodovulum adriaticum]TCP20932.1 TetR family transcriptional regulator [Rhodovulum adriaticum]
MNAPSDRIKRGRKFDQVLEGAREVFLRDGFEGASVDEIARAAGVSKATLYSYFPDKRLLFMEVFRLECDRQTGEALSEIDFSAPIDTVLRQAARHMLASFLAPFNQAVFRICVAEADRFPDLGAAFYESGPLRLRQEIVGHLAEARARGELAIDDLELAADQFAELCKVDLYTRTMFGGGHSFAEAEMTRVIDGAVDMFLARYRA